MSERTAGVVDDAGGDQVWLVMRPGRDRQLLAEWLASLWGYEVDTVDAGGSLPEADAVDLYVLDEVGLAEHGPDIERRQADSDTGYLPCLLVVPEVDADRIAGELARADQGGEGTHVVDDVVGLPVGQAVLRRRIGNLLAARHAFERLQERERQYEELVELTPEALVVLRDGVVLYGNGAAVDVFGVADADALAGRQLRALVAEEDRDALEAVVREVDRRGRTAESQELTVATDDGEARTVEVAGVRVTFDGEPATQLLVRDVTAERRRQQRLDLFNRAIETAAQGVTIADAGQEDTPLVYVNEAFERITGYEAGSVLGRNCRFLQGEATDQRTVDRMRAAIDAGEPVSVELVNYRRDGTPFWNQVDVVPVEDESGTVTHFLGLQRDVTDRKDREERLQVLSRVLRHNLRNSMTVIKGYGESLLDSDDPEVVGAAEHVLASADSLLEMSEHLQEFHSVIATGDQTLLTLNLVAVLEAAVDRLAAEHPAASLTLEAPEAAAVEGHALLPAALEELVALPLSGDGPGAEVELVVTEADDRVVLDLLDHGRTIPEPELAVLETATESATNHPEGIGLWLVRWAVLYSDGELVVDDDGVRRIRVRLRRDRDG